MKPFQLFFVGGMVLVIIIAVFVFANSGSKSSQQAADSRPAVVWGTVPSSYFTDLTNQLGKDKVATINIEYIQKNPATFQADLLEALADGNGPDILLLPQDDLMQNLNRLLVIPYVSYSQRLYQNTFIPESNLFATHDGYAAVPFMIDPMVMYYNKDTLIADNVALPPTYWDQVIGLIPALSNIDTSGNIQKSTIALGEYSNVNNAKDILSMLFLQSGDPIASYTYNDQEKQDRYSVLLSGSNTDGSRPAESALNFYTQFSDPVKSTYSWNGSFASSTDEFLSGNTAFYLGFASEESLLQNKNPNLNFDVTPVPQPRSSSKKVTFGRMYGLALLKSSKNQTNALNQIYTLTSAAVQTDVSSILHLPPTRLDLLQKGSPVADMSVFYASALQSKGWLDINPQQTNSIFQTMVEAVTSGRSLTSEAITNANLQIASLVKN